MPLSHRRVVAPLAPPPSCRIIDCRRNAPALTRRKAPQLPHEPARIPNRQNALQLIDSEIARLNDAKLPGLADHLRGVAELIRSGSLAVSRIDENGMTFEPTEKGRKTGLHDLLPGSAASNGRGTLIIEEARWQQ